MFLHLVYNFLLKLMPGSSFYMFYAFFFYKGENGKGASYWAEPKLCRKCVSSLCACYLELVSVSIMAHQQGRDKFSEAVLHKKYPERCVSRLRNVWFYSLYFVSSQRSLRGAADSKTKPTGKRPFLQHSTWLLVGGNPLINITVASGLLHFSPM